MIVWHHFPLVAEYDDARRWLKFPAKPHVAKGHAGAVNAMALSGDGRLVASGGDDGTVRKWDAETVISLRTLLPDRCYERLDIPGLTGVTGAQRAGLLALGAIEASV